MIRGRSRRLFGLPAAGLCMYAGGGSKDNGPGTFTGLPQLPQNLLPASSSLPQLEHFIFNLQYSILKIIQI